LKCNSANKHVTKLARQALIQNFHAKFHLNQLSNFGVETYGMGERPMDQTSQDTSK